MITPTNSTGEPMNKPNDEVKTFTEQEVQQRIALAVVEERIRLRELEITRLRAARNEISEHERNTKRLRFLLTRRSLAIQKPRDDLIITNTMDYEMAIKEVDRFMSLYEPYCPYCSRTAEGWDQADLNRGFKHVGENSRFFHCSEAYAQWARPGTHNLVWRSPP